MKTKPFVTLLILLFSLNGFASPESDADFLEKISNSFASIGKKAIPATVFIKAEHPQQRLSAFNSGDPFHDEFFKRFFGQEPRRKDDKPEISGGSGVIVQEDGTILTNNHVIKDASKITVVLHDGREFEANVLGSDPETDLAILKIDEVNLPFLKLGDSDKLEIGNLVFAIGSPFALEASLTHGVVSALKRVDLGITSFDNFIQTDAAINPGNSGGPLLNTRGEVIGINTAIFSKNGGYMGIGFAIPSSIVSHVMDQILSNGSVQRAYLGIILQPIDKELSEALSLKNQDGILIAEVAKDSPAMKADLKQGDVITEINGEKIKSAGQFKTQVALKDPGSKVLLTILRNNKTIKVEVTLGHTEEKSEKLLEKLGLQIDNLTPNLARKLGQSQDAEGVVITRVEPNSPAEKAGIKPYFLITGVLQGWGVVQSVNNTNDLMEVLKQQKDRKHVVLVVRHQNYQRYYTLKVD